MKKALAFIGTILFLFAALGCAAKSARATGADLNASTAQEENLTAVQTDQKEEPPAAPKEPMGEIVKFALGEGHTIALDKNGAVWAVGRGKEGQLGLGDFTDKKQSDPVVFERVESLSDKTVVDIFAGYDQSFAIDDKGGVWASGANDGGQLGLGDTNGRAAFAKVESLSAVTAIAAGKGHTIALDKNGAVWASGANFLGQLGLGDLDSRSAFVRVSSLNGKKIVGVAAGRYHSVALDDQGALWIVGSNSYGQLGLGYDGVGTLESEFRRANTGENKIIAIDAGESHSVALDDQGSLWVAGRNINGQLGLGTTTSANAFEKRAGDQRFVAIAAGEQHTIALDNEGGVWATGENLRGQLGLGDKSGRNYLAFERAPIDGKTIAAIASGSYSSFAISYKGEIFVSGQNKDGELGVSGSAARVSFAKLEALSAVAVDLQALYDRGFARICEEGRQPNISDRFVAAIAAGDSHTIVIDGEGKALASGYNERGQLGLNDADNRSAFTEIVYPQNKNIDIVAIAAGEQHTIALDKNGGVWASGHNGYNQLGFEKTEDLPAFAKIADLSGKTIVAVAAGAYHSLALDSEGGVWVSGRNNRGQLGVGDAYDRAAFAEAENLKGKTIVQIAAGGYHSFAVDDKGGVWAAGANDDGQLGVGGDRDRASFTEVKSLNAKTIIAIAAGENFSLALDNEGKVYAAGSNEYGQLGLGAGGKISQPIFARVTSLSGVFTAAIAAGDRHALALDNEGKVYAAGANDSGQLGLGDQNDRLAFSALKNLGGKTIVAAAAGEKHSVLLDSDGRVWSGGQNYYGQLGLGDQVNRNTFTSLEPTGCAKKPAKAPPPSYNEARLP